MKLILRMFQSANVGFCHRFRAPQVVRTFSTNGFFRGADDKQNSDSYESIDDSERRIFGSDNEGSFFKKLGRIEKAYDRSGVSSRISDGNKSESVDHLGLSLNTLSDGMDGKLRDAVTSFTMEDEEVNQEDYSFRPDMDIQWGMVLDTKDLDLRKPAVPRPRKRIEFETTTGEVLERADFRNVRFLANFITEAGIIIKRSKTGISAKAQRKVAREIKTARAFGLMPFTTMGTKQFVFGRTMEDLDEDFEYESYGSRGFVDMNGSEDTVRS